MQVERVGQSRGAFFYWNAVASLDVARGEFAVEGKAAAVWVGRVGDWPAGRSDAAARERGSRETDR
jgi:hypothetical protein